MLVIDRLPHFRLPVHRRAWRRSTITQLETRQMTRALQSFSSKTRAKNFLLDRFRGRHVAPRAPYSPYLGAQLNKVKQREVPIFVARPKRFELLTPRFVVM